MSEIESKVEADRQAIAAAREKGTGATLKTYTKLSGPGWLQGAITLGGGSLAGSLYLGVIGGYQMLWLQPLMMVLGIIMLSAIAYVTLSTGEKPFRSINRHVSPVLGWSWAIATLLANMVWAMPQFSLGSAALEQNLFPGVFGGDSGKYIAALLLFAVAGGILWLYDSGGKGGKFFDILLKSMVAVIVLSFFAVVVSMGFSGTGLTLGEILAGFIPDFSLFTEPAEKFRVALEAVAAEQQEFWRDRILTQQRDIMITAAGTAVGINMTFLLPYSMLKRRWSKDFRGLASFDLATGLFIPFVLAPSCVVIASASQFHGEYDKGLVGEAERTEQSAKLAGGYQKGIDARIKALGSEVEVSVAEKKIASMLVKRDAWQLAGSLDKLTGEGSGSSQLIFGIGVLGMAISTIIILMLINGFTICEMFNLPMSGTAYRVGSFLPGITGALGFLFLWGDSESRLALAIPTSVFGLCLLPLAYITFILLMNNRKVLGDNMLQGGKRTAMNIAMGVAVMAASIGAGFAIWSKTAFYFGSGWYGVGAVAMLVVAAIVIRPIPGAEPGAGE
ncbi:MAG: divalent metal cation transporter, partial [Planctomycetes bacterium]|nr:divalent metal cation transporter [Planctomycetota bacterium]